MSQMCEREFMRCEIRSIVGHQNLRAAGYNEGGKSCVDDPLIASHTSPQPCLNWAPGYNPVGQGPNPQLQSTVIAVAALLACIFYTR